MQRNGAASDVLLINIPDPGRENLGLGYLAATLQREGRSVEIFQPDPSPASSSSQETGYIPQVLQRDFAVLGVSLYAPGIDEATHLVRALGDARPEAHICLGGNFPTVAFAEILQDPGFRGVDSIVLCEGETTFTELVGRISAGADWRGVAGIAFRQDGRVQTTPVRPLQENLDELPFPLRVGRRVGSERFDYEARICSSRGCYANCSFCGVRAFYDHSAGKWWRGRSAGNVVDEMAHVGRTTGRRTFEFVDDNFLGPGRKGRKRALEIAQEIGDRGLQVKFSISCRANDVHVDTLAELKRAGLNCVFLGIESGAQAGLDVFNKGLTVQKNQEALIALRQLRLQVRIGFIFFFPQMTLQDVIENLNFLEKAIRWGAQPDSGGFNALQVYHRTPIHHTLQESGLLSGNYRGYRYEFVDPNVALLHAFMQKPWYETFLGIYKSLAGSEGLAVRQAVALSWAPYADKLRAFLIRACRRAVFCLNTAQQPAEKRERLDELAHKLNEELAIVRLRFENAREVVRVDTSSA